MRVQIESPLGGQAGLPGTREDLAGLSSISVVRFIDAFLTRRERAVK